jgi:hypothetical protein
VTAHLAKSGIVDLTVVSTNHDDLSEGVNMPSERGENVIELASEFAAVRVSLDDSGRGPRLKVEDLESDAVVYLDALELASMCHSTDEQRRAWLKTGPYAVDDD